MTNTQTLYHLNYRGDGDFEIKPIPLEDCLVKEDGDWGSPSPQHLYLTEEEALRHFQVRMMIDSTDSYSRGNTQRAGFEKAGARLKEIAKEREGVVAE